MNKIFKNPYLNSIWAELYIILVVSVMHAISRPNTPDSFIDPVAALSMLVLSASVMGYIFLGEPLQLYLDGEKKKSVAFFMKTVISFAAITIVTLIIVSKISR